MSILILAGSGSFNFTSAQTASCPFGTTLNIVAHEDDDLLFLSPDLLHDIQNGRCVTTVFVTAGDDNLGSTYWHGRENGSKAAYAQMAGALNYWTQSDAGISGHPMPLFNLNGNTDLSLIFMRLPDGNLDGSGFSNNNYESLQKIWENSITSIHAVDGSSSYSKQNITSVLLNIMNNYQPDQIRTQDYTGSYGDGDHSDHHTSAYFAQAAEQQYIKPHTFAGYTGYPISDLPVNIFGNDVTSKLNTFLAYAPFDGGVCQSANDCLGSTYGPWFERQYATETPITPTPTNTPTPAPTTTPKPTTTLTPTPTTILPQSGNIAPQATVTASSEDASTNQQAVKAVDGSIDGWPGDYTKEWATIGGGAGSWLNLSWPSAHTVNKIILYDRPNPDDQITQGTLTFSDGTSVSTGSLNNDGSGVTINFPAKTMTGVRLDITGVSSTTYNIGLSEIQVFESTQTNTPIPTPTSALTPTTAPTKTPTTAPTATPTQIPTGSSTNIAPNGTGYRWWKNTTAFANTNKVAASGINDNNTTQDVRLSNNVSEILNAWEAAGVIWSTAQNNITSVEYTNGSFTSSNDGAFAANFKLQFTTNGTTWTDSGWSNTPLYSYDSSSASGITYTFTGTAKAIMGARITGQVHTLTSSTWYANAAEVKVYTGTIPAPTGTPAPASTNTPTPAITAAPTTALTNTPTPTATATPAPATAPPASGNIAPQATVTASSENASSNQQAVKAIDGVIDGYPGDYTKEWATTGEKNGAWLNLSWPSAHTINKVILYDRPNLDDQITAGTLTFSDGTSIATGELNNDGSGVTVTFSAKTVTSIKLDITGVSSSTHNVGLSEIQIFE